VTTTETETKPPKGKKKGQRPLPVAEQPLPPWGKHTEAEVIEIAPAELLDSPLNTRRTYDPEKIHTLAAKIRRLGWRGQVLARRVPAGIELIYGHRRKRAALLAGCDGIRAELVDVDDATAWDLQAAENAEREDLHPLEEAEAFAWRINQLHGTVEEIADRIDRTVAFVRGRLQLAQLAPKARELFLVGRLLIGHANLLAALQPADQARMLEEGGFVADPEARQDWEEDPWSVRGLAQAIRHDVLLDLGQAPWELHDAGLLAGVPACAECPKRSSAQGDLFPGLREDRCLDPGCFKLKREAFVDRQRSVAQARAKEAGDRPVLEVSSSFGSGYGQKPAKDAPPTTDMYREVAAGAARCGATQPAVVVEGYSDLGRELDVCTDRKCKTHWGAGAAKAGSGAAPGGAAANGPASEGGPTEAEKAARKKELAQQKLEALVRRKTFDQVLDTAADVGTPHIEDARLVARVLWRAVWQDVQAAWAKRRGFEPEKAAAEWRREINGSDLEAVEGAMFELALVQDQLHGVDQASERGDELKKAAKRYQLDSKAIVAEAKAELAPAKKAKPEKAAKAAKAEADSDTKPEKVAKAKKKGKAKL
jgi:ParB family chromosome partitioning protein